MFLFNILGMGAGLSELRKSARKSLTLGNVETCLKAKKILKPGPKTLQTVIIFPKGSY